MNHFCNCCRSCCCCFCCCCCCCCCRCCCYCWCCSCFCSRLHRCMDGPAFNYISNCPLSSSPPLSPRSEVTPISRYTHVCQRCSLLTCPQWLSVCRDGGRKEEENAFCRPQGRRGGRRVFKAQGGVSLTKVTCVPRSTNTLRTLRHSLSQRHKRLIYLGFFYKKISKCNLLPPFLCEFDFVEAFLKSDANSGGRQIRLPPPPLPPPPFDV